MSIPLRRWAMAAALFTAFAIPHLVTQAQNTPAPDAALAKATSTPIVTKTLNLKITAYTSIANETDDTPFITADGDYVHDGIVATNLLPFGTKVIIPALFGDKVFTVDDRMSKKLMNNMDVWMPTYRSAILFGAHITQVLVLSNEVGNGATLADDAAQLASETMAMALGSVSTATGSRLPGLSVRQL